MILEQKKSYKNNFSNHNNFNVNNRRKIEMNLDFGEQELLIKKAKIGNIIFPINNFNMPFVWNRINEFDWNEKESILKEIETESLWRDYYTSKNNKKESNKSYWRANSLKEKLIRKNL